LPRRSTCDLLELLHNDFHEAPTLRSTSSQFSFARPIDPDALGLAEDAIERLLHERAEAIATIDEFEGMNHPDAWCPLRLLALAVLQSRYGVSEREAIRRARRDLAWRYALRLGPSDATPSRSVFQRFLAGLRERHGEDFVHRRCLRLAQQEGLVEDAELQAIDSTNTDCRGAILDTFNLVARGIGNLLRRIADWTGEPVDELAERLWATDYLQRSIKSAVAIDWSSKDEHIGLMTRLVNDALRLVTAMRDPGTMKLAPPADVVDAVELLRRVALQDVEQLPDGRWKIKRGTARGRVVSISDPQASHGRKSGAKKITGYKTHVLATVDGAFVTAVLITDAGTHDSIPSAELIRQAEAVGMAPTRVLGDLAYGTGQNRRTLNDMGVTILTKVGRDGRAAIPKSAFNIDLAAGRVTCPQGQTTEQYTLVKAGKGSDERVRNYKFDKKLCAACPLADKCNSATRKGRARTVKLNVFEPELQAAKAFNASPDAKPLLRKRCGVERVISHLMRYGLRAARYFGQGMTQFQAYMTSAAYNLQRVATLLAARERAASG